MFACDYVVANSDRHWNNFGVIFDAETMRAKRVAPIFDTGSSLWFDKATLHTDTDYRYRPLPLILNKSRKNYPEDQLDIIDDLAWLDPASLDGFADTAARILSESPEMGEERLAAIKTGIGRSVREIQSRWHMLAIPSTKIISSKLKRIGSGQGSNDGTSETRSVQKR